MTIATQARADGRSRDLITLPRAGVEESWMDVQVVAIEVREELGEAHRDLLERRDPRLHLVAAHERLGRLTEYARRRAGEAAGISYISPDQLPLFDGCAPDGRSA